MASAKSIAQPIATTAQGRPLLAPEITRRLIERYVSGPREPVAPPVLTELSPRELDTLKALVRGCSNAEIAAELFLGETTVKTHVAAVLRKLRLRDRVQVVVWAYESGFVTPGNDA